MQHPTSYMHMDKTNSESPQTAIAPEKIRFTDSIHPGGMWSHIMKRRTTLRIVNVDGRANVSALFFNADCFSERYNMPDTLKAQHIARLCAPYVLYSDMGRILCSITADTMGWHDTICGVSNRTTVAEKYGTGDYQDLRNDFHRNGEDNFLIELGKYGLGRLDLVANVNFFSRVRTDATETGILKFIPGSSRPGDFVDLRFEMNVLTVLTTCPHPLDPEKAWKPGTVSLTVYQSDPPTGNDPSRTVRPENARGFENTDRYYL